MNGAAGARHSIGAVGARSRNIASACALLGVVCVAVGCALVGRLPAPDASGQVVFARFLDDRTSLRIGAVLLVLGLALLLAFVTSLRTTLDPERGNLGAAAMLPAAFLAITVLVFSAAAIGALAVGAENAAPGSSRAILDLAQAATAAAGPLLATALIAAWTAMRRARAPAGVRLLALAAALGCLLWLAPLVTDADLLEPGSPLGFVAGLVLVLLWLLSTALWLRRRPQ